MRYPSVGCSSSLPAAALAIQLSQTWQSRSSSTSTLFQPQICSLQMGHAGCCWHFVHRVLWHCTAMVGSGKQGTCNAFQRTVCSCMHRQLACSSCSYQVVTACACCMLKLTCCIEKNPPASHHVVQFCSAHQQQGMIYSMLRSNDNETLNHDHTCCKFCATHDCFNTPFLHCSHWSYGNHSD